MCQISNFGLWKCFCWTLDRSAKIELKNSKTFWRHKQYVGWISTKWTFSMNDNTQHFLFITFHDFLRLRCLCWHRCLIVFTDWKRTQANFCHLFIFCRTILLSNLNYNSDSLNKSMHWYPQNRGAKSKWQTKSIYLLKFTNSPT